MSTGSSAQDAWPPGAQQVLRRSDARVVTRSADSRAPADEPRSATVITKRLTADAHHPHAFAQLEHEHEVLTRLEGIPGVPAPIWLDPIRGELAMQDMGPEPMGPARSTGPMPWSELMPFAIGLARLLAAVHERGVVHCRISPANLVVCPPGTLPALIDWSHALRIDRTAPDSVLESLAPDALPYLAPEQTGSMNRRVDHRCDLYAVGVVLYELCTGRLPFEDSDPLSLIHAHLARLPESASSVNSAVPQALSSLLMRLLAKDPGRRHQSAQALQADLARLQRDPMHDIEVGWEAADVRSPAAPDLIGRHKEMAKLAALLEETADGHARHVFIHGPSGVGKSALARQLQEWMRERPGLFIAGKFDQFRHLLPLSAPLQAAADIAGQLLSGTDASVALWSERLNEAMAPNAALLTRLVPLLASLMGPQPDVPDAEPAQTRVWLQQALKSLLQTLAAPQHPLVLLLDYLQWSDAASLDFLDSLRFDTGLRARLVVATYRSDEVVTGHPLVRWLERTRTAMVASSDIALEPLPPADAAAMLSNLLPVSLTETDELARSVHARSLGNPYHVVELAHQLRASGAELGIDAADWVAMATQTLGDADASNLDLLLTHRLQSFDADTRRMLQLAATLGVEFNLETLSTLAIDDPVYDAGGQARAEGFDRSALLACLLRPTDRGVLLLVQGDPWHDDSAPSRFAFCHDRMQQAAYGLVEEAERSAVHLAIARRLDDAGRGGLPHAAVVIEIASHYAQAIDSLETEADRKAAFDMLVTAAAESRRSTAFTQAARFLELAKRLMPADAWDAGFEDTFALEMDLYTALFNASRFIEADAVYDNLLLRARQPDRLTAIARLQLTNIHGRHGTAAALHMSLDFFRRIGMEVPKDFKAAAEQELDAFYRMADELPLEALADASNADPAINPLQRMIQRLAFAAHDVDPAIACWLLLQSSRAWQRHGYTTNMSDCMALLALTLIQMRQDFAMSKRVLSLAVSSRQRGPAAPAASGGQRRIDAPTSYSYLCQWFETVETAFAAARQEFDAYQQVGDMQGAFFRNIITLPTSLDAASHFDQASKEVAAASQLAARLGTSRHRTEVVVPYRQFIRALRGQTEAPGSFSDDEFDDAQYLAAPDASTWGHLHFHLYRAFAAALFADDLALRLHVEQAAALMPKYSAYYCASLHAVMASLSAATQLRQLSSQPSPQREPLLRTLATHAKWMAERAADMPANFEHLHHFIAAVHADVEDRFEDALRHFERAMHTAHAHHRLLHHAFITEQAGLCYLRHGLHSSGRDLLRRALRCYASWGVTATVAHLRSSWDFLREPSSSSSASSSSEPLPDAPQAFDVDRLAILEASQALSSETDLSRLVT
ncbi:MAG: hypothetical protein JWP52_435, partial [Rhizobacter sp.]|nr:hypothetical protein [Rhizobacter sp.]